MTDLPDGFPESEAVAKAQAKAQAKRLSAAMGGKRDLSHAQALEMIAKTHGMGTWAQMKDFLDRRSRSTTAEPQFVFTLPDLLSPLETLDFGRDRDGITHHIHEAYRDCVPGVVATGSQIPDLVATMDARFSGSHGYPLRGDKAAGKVVSGDLIVKEMLNWPQRLDDAVRTAGEGRRSLPAWDRRVPEMERRTHLKTTIEILKHDGHEVADLVCAQDYGPLNSLSFLDLRPGTVAVNPVSILKVMMRHGTPPLYAAEPGRREPLTVAAISVADLQRTRGADIMYAQARSLGIRILLVSDKHTKAEISLECEQAFYAATRG